MGVQNVMLLLTALYQFKVHDNFMERLRRSRFVQIWKRIQLKFGKEFNWNGLIF